MHTFFLCIPGRCYIQQIIIDGVNVNLLIGASAVSIWQIFKLLLISAYSNGKMWPCGKSVKVGKSDVIYIFFNSTYGHRLSF